MLPIVKAEWGSVSAIYLFSQLPPTSQEWLTRVREELSRVGEGRAQHQRNPQEWEVSAPKGHISAFFRAAQYLPSHPWLHVSSSPRTVLITPPPPPVIYCLICSKTLCHALQEVLGSASSCNRDAEGRYWENLLTWESVGVLRVQACRTEMDGWRFWLNCS